MTLQNDLSVGMNLEVVRSYSILKKDGRENNDLSYSNKGVTLFLCYVKLQSNTILFMAPWPQDVIAHSPLQNTAVVRKVVGKRTKVHATILRGIIWVSNNNNSSNPWCLNFIVMFYQISLKSWGQVTLTLNNPQYLLGLLHML